MAQDMSRETLAGPEAYRAQPPPHVVVNGEATPLGDEVLTGAACLAAEGLVDAFGHVSAREDGRAVLTPPRPLGSLAPGERLPALALDAEDLPPDVPREAWLHWAIYRGRPDVRAVCRAQPPSPLALGVAGVPVRALHGQGALVGAEVPVFDDARLVRDRERGEAVAATLGDAWAVVLRGNGAVTVGASVGHAVARMWLLERSAGLNALALRAGEARPLRPEELEAWQATGDELLERLWGYLRGRVAAT